MRFAVGRLQDWLVGLALFGVGISVARGDEAVTQKPEIATSFVVEPGKPIDPAAPRDAFHLLPGFQVERLFSVPKETHGSWVSMTIDPQGRIIASDEGRSGLYRITPSPIGSNEPTKVERLGVKLSSAQGLLFAFGSLYVTQNGKSALYRLRDTDGDDQFDEVKELAEFAGNGEHGPHGLRLSPDGKQIYLVAGDHTRNPLDIEADLAQRMGGVRTGQRHAKLDADSKSRLSPNWDEDLLLPRQWDSGGWAVGILAPCGWIAATDPDGQTWDLLTTGFRNTYDIALNADGELFAYDSDMEWEYGLSWYHPTRVLHAVAGADFGSRSGTGRWPAYRVDTLPAAVNIGPGSPVGLEFGYGTKFPAKYQRALFALDWSYGTIYAVHLTPDGASYTGTKEEFLSRTPLPVTDVAVGPDGALYFTTGGRGTQSELYRVTYTGAESTAPVDPRNSELAELRALRKKIEAYLGPQDDPAEAVKEFIPLLSHADRHLRYAARVALERIAPNLWQNRVLAETNPDTVIGGVVALAHTADSPLQPALLAALDRLDFESLTARQQLDLLRAYELVCIRLGAPDSEVAARLAARLDAFYPVKAKPELNSVDRDALNRDLCELLVFLKSPTVVTKTIALMKEPDAAISTITSTDGVAELAARNPQFGNAVAATLANPPNSQRISYVFSLRNLREGWTPAQRVFYFTWLRDEHKHHPNSHFQKFLDNVEQEAYDNATDTDRLAVEAAGVRQPFKAVELPAPLGPGQAYTVDGLVALSGAHPKGRNFASGKRTFAASRCVVCHRFAGEGGSTGPDLTQAAGRFNLRDLAESLIDPSKVVSDLYRTTAIQTDDGRQLIGRVIGETADSITLLTDPEDSTKWVLIPKGTIESRSLSPTSLMPQNLLSTLNENEVLDLLAYLLSRGNPDDPLFAP
jgi:putative heme-binding domain-containing protein